MKPFNLHEISLEIIQARELHPTGFRNAHEAYGVLAEEVAEFFDEVRRKSIRKECMKRELIQIACVAARAIEDLDL